jgi:hypothetical protein
MIRTKLPTILQAAVLLPILGLMLASQAVYASLLHPGERSGMLKSERVKAEQISSASETSMQVNAGGFTSSEEEVDWYRWYRQLRGYLRANGGVWCRPDTPIRFERDGRITAETDDPQCSMSLRRLHYAIPSNARVSEITLSVPAGKKPLSRDELQARIDRQLPHAARLSTSGK